jgi:hypothetical protein
MRRHGYYIVSLILALMSQANFSNAAQPIEVWVGAPADGTWPSACTPEKSFYPSNACSLPAWHWDLNSGSGAMNDGDWSVDLRIKPGVKLYLYVAPQVSTDVITTQVEAVTDACTTGKGGKAVKIAVYNKSLAKIGQIIYAHLVPADGVKAGAKIDSWGGYLGKVADKADGLTYNTKCWTGPHVHFEMYNRKGFSCYNRGFTPDSTFSSTNFLGFLGGDRVSTPRTPCP